jgi:hypothetical protein
MSLKMKMKCLNNYEFNFVCRITPVLDENGRIEENRPQDSYAKSRTLY